jgi:hypothetical protein
MPVVYGIIGWYIRYRMKIFGRLRSLNILMVAVLVLTFFSIIYFIYSGQRTKSFVYVSVSLIRPTNLNINIPPNTVPYWIADSINIGDREQNLLGNVGAVVVDKESYDWIYFGQVVDLTLKVKADKDRSGVYLYRNKPLIVGSQLDLKLSKTQVQGIVTDISNMPIQYENRNFEITLRSKQAEVWVVKNLKIGEELKDNKGNIIAKIKDFKTFPSASPVLEFRSNNLTNSMVIDSDKSDLEVTVDISCKLIGDICYFAKTQKIKANEEIYIPFKSISLDYTISSVKPFPIN